MLFVTIDANAFCKEYSSEALIRADITAAFQSLDFDMFSNITYNSNSYLQNLNINNSVFILNNKKTDNCQNCGNSKFLMSYNSEIEYFPELFYPKNILKNNSGIRIVMMFPQIQPNAP